MDRRGQLESAIANKGSRSEPSGSACDWVYPAGPNDRCPMITRGRRAAATGWRIL